MTPALLDAEIKATQTLTRRPFGVNLITMHPQLMDLVEVCRANNTTHVVFAGGVPPGEAIKKGEGILEGRVLRTGRGPSEAPYKETAPMRWSSKAQKLEAISAPCLPRY